MLRYRSCLNKGILFDEKWTVLRTIRHVGRPGTLRRFAMVLIPVASVKPPRNVALWSTQDM